MTSAAAAKNDPIEVEARTAAADAAADARADVRQEAAKAKASVSKLETSKKAATDALKDTWKEFAVDVWITPFNSIEARAPACSGIAKNSGTMPRAPTNALFSSCFRKP